jgi:hypothetical protein
MVYTYNGTSLSFEEEVLTILMNLKIITLSAIRQSHLGNQIGYHF